MFVKSLNPKQVLEVSTKKKKKNWRQKYFEKSLSKYEKHHIKQTMKRLLCPFREQSEKIYGIKFTSTKEASRDATKLDGVGPVDNTPSPDKLQHFVKKKKMWHLTRATWPMAHDTWLMTCDMWHMAVGEHSHKISGPQLLWFGIHIVLKNLNKRITQLTNELMN